MSRGYDQISSVLAAQAWGPEFRTLVSCRKAGVRLYLFTPAPVRRGRKLPFRERHCLQKQGGESWRKNQASTCGLLTHMHAYMQTNLTCMNMHTPKKKRKKKETFLFFYVNQVSGNEILISRYFILSGSISPRVSFSLFCLWTSLILLQIFLVEKLHYLFYNIGCQWERLIFVRWFSYLEKTSMADFPEDFTGPFERLHGRQPLSLVGSFISCNGDWIRDRAGCGPTFQ